MNKACKKLGQKYLDGCEVYVTLEPCAMCAGAMLNYRIKRLYFGAWEPKTGCAGSLYNLLTDKRFNHRVEVAGGILEEECALMLKNFFAQRRKKRTLIIAGLGNPGEKYEKTYHNMGYGAIDALSLLYGVKVKRAECSSLTAAVNDGGVRVILAKPITYMNLSGQAVKSLLRKYDAGIEDLIVVYDDADLTRFALRAKAGGLGGRA